jgi:metallopeptidase MepB
MLNCNPPSENRPSLLKYREVVSCFHELGHAIHWLVSQTMHSRFHGTTVARDFVEVPSKMLEHFFWDRNVIRAMSCHFAQPQLDIKVSEGLIDDLIATRFDNVALGQLSNLVFSTFDMTVHTSLEATLASEASLSVMFNKMRHEMGLLQGPEDLGRGYDTVHGQTHFRHICGYAASYYAYLV